jgi:peptidoglycan/xylan/chitin deacetylase (PgdA/CDA1 family)
MRRLILLLGLGSLFLSACSLVNLMARNQPLLPVTPLIPNPTGAPQATPTQFQPVAATDTPAIATDTPTPEPIVTPTPTQMPTWIGVPSGKISAPILLYHHIAEPVRGAERYYISAATFEQQIKSLHDWGYTSIKLSTLATVLTQGGDLPPRPMVISFDDGNLDVYQNAFPILKKYGFTGTLFIVANRLASKNFMNSQQLKEMVAAGWEIGSHGMTHADLKANPGLLPTEAEKSRTTLTEALQTPVNVFAYPYGLSNILIQEKMSGYGYLAAVGLGGVYRHDPKFVFNLSRIEIQNSFDLAKFTSLLPWSQ